MINIRLNGKKEELPQGMSVAQLLKKKNIRPEVVTVELNEQILIRQEFEKTLIKEGDSLEFVYFMGGGSSSIAFGVAPMRMKIPLHPPLQRGMKGDLRGKDGDLKRGFSSEL